MKDRLAEAVAYVLNEQGLLLLSVSSSGMGQEWSISVQIGEAMRSTVIDSFSDGGWEDYGRLADVIEQLCRAVLAINRGGGM